MHPVEIPDRDYRAVQRFDLRAVVADHHKRLGSVGLRHERAGLARYWRPGVGRSVTQVKRLGLLSSLQALRRPGTDTIASPSRTIALSTSASQCSRTFRPSGTS